MTSEDQVKFILQKKMLNFLFCYFISAARHLLLFSLLLKLKCKEQVKLPDKVPDKQRLQKLNDWLKTLSEMQKMLEKFAGNEKVELILCFCLGDSDTPYML